jgi:hypothetical protein
MNGRGFGQAPGRVAYGVRMFNQLFQLSRRVAKTHNGKNYPRIEQIEAMKALQEYITYLEKVNSDQVSDNPTESLVPAP